jgi:hypothetical protein
MARRDRPHSGHTHAQDDSRAKTPSGPRLAPEALATNVLAPPSGIEVRPAGARGRGVFAARDFAAGEVVERAPVLVLPASEAPAAQETVLGSYVFGWRDSVAVGLGLASLYNHAWEPNLDYFRRLDEGCLEFVTRRAVSVGEELTINYTSGNPHRSDLWVELT